MDSDYVQYPEGHVLLRNFKWRYPRISHGDGVYLFDQNGDRYLDAAGGAFVNCLGHDNSRVVDAISRQMRRVAYVNGKHFTSDVAEEFASKVAHYAPGSLNRVSLLNSGSDAVEAAIKFCLQLWVERKELGRNKIIARNPSYHGNTLMALSASARPSFKRYFGSHLKDFASCSTPNFYRSPVADYWKSGAKHYLDELEELIQKEGAQSIAAFILEPMPASSCAAALPPDGYLKGVEKICASHGILMIADEVACGSGRTGKFFASNHWDFQPDVAVLGKAINAGFVPLAAMVVKEEHLSEIAYGSGNFLHAQTYLQSPSVAACGLAVIEEIESRNLMENCSQVGDYLLKELKEKLLGLPHVGHVDGKGFLIGIDLVANKESKEPFAAKENVSGLVATQAFHNGCVVWSHSGHVGERGDLLMIAPPYILNKKQADEIVSSLKKSLEEFKWPSPN